MVALESTSKDGHNALASRIAAGEEALMQCGNLTTQLAELGGRLVSDGAERHSGVAAELSALRAESAAAGAATQAAHDALTARLAAQETATAASTDHNDNRLEAVKEALQQHASTTRAECDSLQTRLHELQSQVSVAICFAV